MNLLEERKNRALIQSDSLRSDLRQQCHSLAGVAGMVEQGFNFGIVGYNTWNSFKPARRSNHFKAIARTWSLLRFFRRFLT